MKDCNFCYEKERFPQIKKENEQLKSELETYQILAHKRGECYLSSLREIKKQKEENEQLTLQIEKMKNWCNCKNYQECLIELAAQGKGMKPSECCVNCKKWELKE